MGDIAQRKVCILITKKKSYRLYYSFFNSFYSTEEFSKFKRLQRSFFVKLLTTIS